MTHLHTCVFQDFFWAWNLRTSTVYTGLAGRRWCQEAMELKGGEVIWSWQSWSLSKSTSNIPSMHVNQQLLAQSHSVRRVKQWALSRWNVTGAECVCVCCGWVPVSYQWRRRACRKADSPSMMSRMATVSVAKAEKIIERPKNPPPLLEERPRRITMDQRTSDSSAHSRRPQQPCLHLPASLSHISLSCPNRPYVFLRKVDAHYLARSQSYRMGTSHCTCIMCALSNSRAWARLRAQRRR